MDLSSLLRYEGMTLEIVIWSLFIGIVIGIFGSFYVKQVLGAFVRKLLEENASSPESAKTLRETGFDKNYFVINALRPESTLRKLIARSPEDETEGAQVRQSAKERKKALLESGWYIPEELCGRAENMYESKGNTIGIALISVLAFLIAALISFTVIPDLVSMASGAFGSFGA